MNQILDHAGSRVVPIRLLLRDLSALRLACVRRHWDFCAGQQTYRCLDLMPGASAGWKPCTHAIAIPGCRQEVGLVDQGDHFLPVFEPDADPALVLGPGAGLLWQAYAGEKIRLEAARHGHVCSHVVDSQGTRRYRLRSLVTRQSAHVMVTRTGHCTLRTIGQEDQDGWEEYAYLAHAPGTPCLEEVRKEGPQADLAEPPGHQPQTAFLKPSEESVHDAHLCP